MKKIFQTSFYVFAFLIGTSAFSQTEIFKVMSSNGGVMVHAGTEQSKALIGKKIHPDDVISVPDKGYVGLLHVATGRTIELKTAGNHTAKDLVAKIAVKSSSMTDKYSKYVMEELTRVESGDIASTHHKNMKVTGSVERAISSSSLPVCLPKQSDLVEGTHTIIWLKNPKAKGYIVEVSNMFDEIVSTQDTDDTTYVLDRNALKLSKDNFLKVVVKLKNAPDVKSAEYGLKFIVLDKSNAAFVNEYEEVKSNYEDPSAINYLVKASYFRSKKAFLDAKTNYEKAIALEPEVQAYKKAYAYFLQEYNLGEFNPYAKQ